MTFADAANGGEGRRLHAMGVAYADLLNVLAAIRARASDEHWATPPLTPLEHACILI